MGRVERTLVRQHRWGPGVGMAWYWERGGSPFPVLNGKVVLALNADQLRGGYFPPEIHLTVEWDEEAAKISDSTG
jgi:hypothetical protein